MLNPRSLRLGASLVLGLLSGAPLAAEPPNTLSREEIAEGWILLFDGETDFGWKAAGKANWKVAGGVISVSEGEKGLSRALDGLCRRVP